MVKKIADDQITSLPEIGPLADTQFAGYASIFHPPRKQKESELFYWFAGTKNYQKQPTILWSNGGPGSSSFWGLFIENGPFVFKEGKSGKFELKPNPNGWNHQTNYLMFEHPLGVTLSFCDDKSKNLPQNVAQGVDQLYRALLNFMAMHPELADNPLVLAGESYAGTYLPLLAKAILEGNQQPGNLKLDLKTVVLCDAWVDPVTQMATDTTYALGRGLITPEQKAMLDEKYQHNYPQVNQAIQEICGCYMTNLAQTADPPFHPVLDYINRADVRKAIHVDSKVKVAHSWSQAISNNYAFGVNDSYAGLVQEQIEAGMQYIVISGLNDAKDCNFLGTGAWLGKLQGDIVQKFHQAGTTQWKDSANNVLGFIQNGGGLSWVKVLNAGHMAARDQPKLIELIKQMSCAW